jgi:trans-aconitate 2-methyltransferase
MVWNTAQYDRFSSPRLRPALELLDRIEIDDPRLVYDLGCGTGEITVLLAERYRAARVVGLDSSEDMLEEARKRDDAAFWEEADIAGWKPPTPVDLIYSNAALQWLGDHETLFPRLLSELESGGENEAALSSELLRSELARPWVLDSSDYYRILAPHASAVDVWTTEYLHVLEGEEPVFEWVKGTGLRPILNRLDAA